MNWTAELRQLEKALDKLSAGFDTFGYHGSVDEPRVQDVLQKVATMMHDNYPYHSPLYAGQMLKPPHPVARIAYALSLWINPNNHALDGGRASSAMEKVCVQDIAMMFGWTAHLGHLTSGGTMANLEALWISGELAPGTTVVASDQAHYTHGRISQVLKLPFRSVATNRDGCIDLTALEAELSRGDVGTVVATLGTTGVGAVDDLPAILKLRERFDFRVHVDAAYGGYFSLSSVLEPEIAARYAAICEADSIVVDPHKHGLQPYGCGCIIFKDQSVGKFYKHDSAYTYFSSDELHLGEISLECSRAGAAAVALWATHQLLPLTAEKEFAGMLDACLQTARSAHQRFESHPAFAPLLAPMLDIVVYSVRGDSLAAIDLTNQKVFDQAGKLGLHLAVFTLPAEVVASALGARDDGPTQVRVLRSVMMKPEQADAIDEFFARLDKSLLMLTQ